MFPIYQSMYKTSPHEGEKYIWSNLLFYIFLTFYNFLFSWKHYFYFYHLNDINSGGPDNGFPDIASHSLALQFLSNNIGSKSNHPFISSSQFIQHINRNSHPITNINPFSHISKSQYSDIAQHQTEHSESSILIPNSKESELSSISPRNKEAFKTSVTPMSSTSSRLSPTMISSTQGGGSNLTHLSQPPYGKLPINFFW